MNASHLHSSALFLILAPAALASGGPSIFSVEKQQVYDQVSTATPIQGTVGSVPSFSGTIEAPEAATVTPPGLAATAITYNSGNEEYELNGVFTAKTGLDAAYPDGSYQFTSSGNPTFSISMPSDLYPAVVPQVVGGTWQNNVLVLNAAVPNTIQFSTFSNYSSTSGGQVAGLMMFKLQSATNSDNVSLKQQYATQAVGGSTASSTPFTSYTIPAGTLTPGLVYQAQLEFDSLAALNTTTVPGSVIAGIFGNYTQFYVVAPAASQPAAPVITQQPASIAGPLGSSVTLVAGYTPATTGSASPTVAAWYFNGQQVEVDGVKYVTSQNGGSLTINNLASTDAGNYGIQVFNSAGWAISNRATVSIGAATGTPVITAQPNLNGSTITINAGTTVVLSVGASNALSYQWQINGANVTQGNASGTTSPTLLLTGAGNLNVGTYACIVTGGSGSVTSNLVQVATTNASSPGRLGNLSVLTSVTSSPTPLTVGFVVGGTGTSGSQTLLLRGDGPMLAASPFNISTAITNPEITLFNSSSAQIAQNSSWGANQAAVTAAEANTFAFSFAAGSKDAALVSSLAPGNYSVQVTSTNSGVGTVLCEVFDDTASGAYTLATPRLGNLSCLDPIAQGATLTAGFVVGGTTAKTVLIRASGPALALAPFNFSGTMSDPQLQVFNTTGGANIMLASNASWGGNAQIASVAASVYAFAWTNSGSHDAAVLVTLPPGNYTAQVNSVSGASGTALVEVYEVP